MKNNWTIILSIVGVVLAVVVPIYAAMEYARNEGLRAETSRALSFARDVMNRSTATTQQVSDAVAALTAVPSAEFCSEERLEIMRRYDVGSSYIQAIGHISEDYIRCSSLGLGVEEFYVGPVDVVQPNGVLLRNHTRIPFIEDQEFLIIESEGYAAVIHQDLLVDMAAGVEGLSLATISRFDRAILRQRGDIDPEWLTLAPASGEQVFITDDHVIAVIESPEYLVDAIAAIPIGDVEIRIDRLTTFMVPAGVLASALMAFSVITLTRSQMSMPSAIRSALRRKEFFLQYQPIVDLQSGEWIGAEALIRWRRGNGTLIGPDLFIPIAEATGLIQRITGYVMDRIADDFGDFFVQHPQFHVAINLSTADIQDEKTVGLIHQLIGRTRARPGNILVEVTERGFSDPELANKVIHDLHAVSVEVAIDDFGTGYSSLSLLSNLDVEYLKIDKSFVDSIGTHAATSHVISHIIAMAKELDLQMIAEGVETEEQAAFLRAHGVQFAQGWLFSRPVSAQDLWAAKT